MKLFAFISLICYNVILFAQSDQIITIQISKSTSYQHKLKLSDIAENVEYISLETTHNSLIGNTPVNYTLTKDYVFVMQTGRVLQFHRDGKFMRQVNIVGQGPGECFARCVAFDEKNQHIYMYNNYTYNIMVFGFDGKFKYKFKDPLVDPLVDQENDFFVLNMNCDSMGNLFLSFHNSYGNMPYKYVVITSSGKILHIEPNSDLYPLKKTDNGPVSLIFEPSPFYSCQNFMYYKYTLNDTIYKIEQNRCVATYVINLPEKLTLKDVMKAIEGTVSFSDIADKSEIYTNTIHETDKYLFLNHDRIQKTFLSLYDKHKHELIANIDPVITNDIDGGIDLHTGKRTEQVICKYDTYMYVPLWPFQMKEQVTFTHFSKSKVLYPAKQRALKTIINKLSEDDNPVLMIIKLK
jgi:hypothetical protein